MSNSTDPEQFEKPTSYIIGEWLIVTASALILFVVAGYLAYSFVRSQPRLVPISITPQISKGHQVKGRYVLPLRVSNQGQRSLSSWTGRVQFNYNGHKKTIRIQGKYLVPGSVKKVYVELPTSPAALGNLRFIPLSYQT